MTDYIYGSFQYCYNGIPVLRGYCSYKTLIKFSQPHPAYQRMADDMHIEEIKAFLNGTGYKFMPEITLSFDYSGMFANVPEWDAQKYSTPFEYLISNQPGIRDIKVWDYHKGVEFQRMKSDSINKTIRIKINSGNPLFNTHQIFNRIDGNHRLTALEELAQDDFPIPYCIVLLCGDGLPNTAEKVEMDLFHNINSKAKSLTPIEQYRGLFNLFTVAELEQYGNEFSLTKAYLEKHGNLQFKNLSKYFADKEDIVLFCIKFFLDRGIDVTEDDIASVFSNLEHTYFEDYSDIKNCQSRFALIPYVFYCYKGGKHKNAKLSAYDAWFRKNKLYHVKDLDPASMIDVFDRIYEIRQKQIFVAMPFKSELDFVFTAICNAVEKINRDNDLELLPPIRIDKQIVGFSYDIVNEILDSIQNAGLLIADLTEQNANVYYEAGYAQGLLKAKFGSTSEILYLISNPQNPDDPFRDAKFDVQHFKMIPYKNAGNGAAELQKSIEKELKQFYCI